LPEVLHNRIGRVHVKLPITSLLQETPMVTPNSLLATPVPALLSLLDSDESDLVGYTMLAAPIEDPDEEEDEDDPEEEDDLEEEEEDEDDEEDYEDDEEIDEDDDDGVIIEDDDEEEEEDGEDEEEAEYDEDDEEEDDEDAGRARKMMPLSTLRPSRHFPAVRRQ
jgi:hypothetical protein